MCYTYIRTSETYNNQITETFVMKNAYSNLFMSHMLGADTEKAYAAAFGTRVIGSIGDGGRDVPTGVADVPFVQVKSSVKGLRSFLVESLRRHKFIPICVGEPGAKDEMLAHLRQFGVWLGKDVQNRSSLQSAVAQVRAVCAEKIDQYAMAARILA